MNKSDSPHSQCTETETSQRPAWKSKVLGIGSVLLLLVSLGLSNMYGSSKDIKSQECLTCIFSLIRSSLSSGFPEQPTDADLVILQILEQYEANGYSGTFLNIYPKEWAPQHLPEYILSTNYADIQNQGQ